MAIDERILRARRNAETTVPATLRHVMAERWGRVNNSELSRRTGVAVSTVRNHVTGRNAIPTDDLTAYAVALSVPSWLLLRSSEEAIAWIREHADDDPDTLSRAIPGLLNSRTPVAA